MVNIDHGIGCEGILRLRLEVHMTVCGGRGEACKEVVIFAGESGSRSQSRSVGEGSIELESLGCLLWRGKANDGTAGMRVRVDVEVFNGAWMGEFEGE